VLELGGKSVNLVLPGTDLAAASPAIHGRFLRNAGQGCASPTRLLVERDRVDEFVELAQAAFASIPLGDPRDPRTAIGPLITAAHRDRVTGFVAEARADGAELLAGSAGPPPPNRGWFVSPALLGGIGNDHRIAREEVFGPVAVLLPYDSVDEAVAVANDSSFGLSGNVFGPSVGEAIAVAGRLRAGHVTVNGGSGMRPDGPFGGLRRSGIGREGGEWGIREFLEPQQVQWPL
jgi:aldehyde dehydrogenase (NAD+)/betaine-aldehyde dehydrogenase